VYEQQPMYPVYQPQPMQWLPMQQDDQMQGGIQGLMSAFGPALKDRFRKPKPTMGDSPILRMNGDSYGSLAA